MPARCCWPRSPIRDARGTRRTRVHIRHGQARRPRRIHQRDHSRDDRAPDRLRGGVACSRPCRSISARRFRSRRSALRSTSLARGCSAAAASSWHHGPGHGHGMATRPTNRSGSRRRRAKRRSMCSRTAFRRASLRRASGPALPAGGVSVETTRPDGTRQVFAFADRGGFLESIEEVPEPHDFTAYVRSTADDDRSRSRSTRTPTARRRATTTCGRRSFTCSPTRPYRCS